MGWAFHYGLSAQGLTWALPVAWRVLSAPGCPRLTTPSTSGDVSADAPKDVVSRNPFMCNRYKGPPQGRKEAPRGSMEEAWPVCQKGGSSVLPRRLKCKNCYHSVLAVMSGIKLGLHSICP